MYQATCARRDHSRAICFGNFGSAEEAPIVSTPPPLGFESTSDANTTALTPTTNTDSPSVPLIFEQTTAEDTKHGSALEVSDANLGFKANTGSANKIGGLFRKGSFNSHLLNIEIDKAMADKGVTEIADISGWVKPAYSKATRQQFNMKDLSRLGVACPDHNHRAVEEVHWLCY